jgi:luciferase family oxidoreductase group 1
VITLSVLDQVPLFHGSTAVEALHESITLAQTVERLGYRRFWIAEHHNMGHFACATPEILATMIATHTTHIRVGSGGVMLPNYSSLKVAETFHMLSTLFPDRIDLGIGRGPGANAPASTALRSYLPVADADLYIQQVQELIGFLENAFPERHPYKEVRAVPDGPGTPEVWGLGAGRNSAEIAASLGLAFCFAQFTHADRAPEVIELYRQRFRPSSFLKKPRTSLAVRVLCAESEEKAKQLALSFWLVSMGAHKKIFAHSQTDFVPAPSFEDAFYYNYSEQEQTFVHEHQLMQIVGDPIHVKTQLTELAHTYNIDELVVLTICPDFQARLRSYELLAEMFDLSPTHPDGTAGTGIKAYSSVLQ